MARSALLLSMLFLWACDHGSPTNPLDTPCPGLPFDGSARIEGSVIHRGVPAPGVVVVVGDRNTTTTPDGSFAIGGVPAGPLLLQVGSLGTINASGTVQVLSSYNYVRISAALPDGGAMSGRTIDGCTGRPISGVVIRLSFREATSGPDGIYEMDNLCCSTLGTLQATKAGYRPTTTSIGRAYGTGYWLDLVMIPE